VIDKSTGGILSDSIVSEISHRCDVKVTFCGSSSVRKLLNVSHNRRQRNCLKLYNKANVISSKGKVSNIFA